MCTDLGGRRVEVACGTRLVVHDAASAGAAFGFVPSGYLHLWHPAARHFPLAAGTGSLRRVHFWSSLAGAWYSTLSLFAVRGVPWIWYRPCSTFVVMLAFSVSVLLGHILSRWDMTGTPSVPAGRVQAIHSRSASCSF